MLEDKIAHLAVRYNYKAVHCCTTEHQDEARKLFRFFHKTSVQEYRRRRNAVVSAEELLAKARIKLATLQIENGTQHEKAETIAMIGHYVTLRSQRIRRLNELNANN